jgi:tagaturonate reductase
MKHIDRKQVEDVRQSANLYLPTPEQLNYPEKVIQFGTGVLLRGLPDQYIDDANRNGKFCGRIVVVKSTGVGSLDAFGTQQGLYTLCVRGIRDGETVDHTYVNASISRVLSAAGEWNEVLRVAESDDLRVVISNTTEVGITDSEDNIHSGAVPSTFPGKLLALLFHRFKVFKGDPNRGLVIIPTELIEYNGNRLKAILFSLANKNNLGIDFVRWLQDSNPVCNSLVDRIVPGSLSPAIQQEKEYALGYTDQLMIMAEPFRLWAIESSAQRVAEVLSFTNTDHGCFVVPDISRYKELKLRLLNGTHTFSCGIALLAGNELVRESMGYKPMGDFIRRLVVDEIADLITGTLLSFKEARDFALAVVDRFSNPFIDHKWSAISAQFTAKMKMRNIPLIMSAAEKMGRVPSRMAIGFAAYLVCMDTAVDQDGQYIVQHAKTPFVLTDGFAAEIHELWQQKPTRKAVLSILSAAQIWGSDLSLIPGFSTSVIEACEQIIASGITELVKCPEVF